MFIRQIHYLLALARTHHFGRAAETCHVTQPALSSGIQHLEEELGVALIQRGQKFQGFTAEGLRLLTWAQQLEQSWDGLKQEAALCHQHLNGILRVGAIPTALAITPLLTEPYQAQYPGVSIRVLSLAAEDLIHQLDEYTLDLGITYLEDTRLKNLMTLPLYQEQHVLISRDTSLRTSAISWSEAAKLPLCLLTPNMQNRQLIDAAFKEADAIPNVMIETDSVIALYSHVRCAGLYSIVPHSLLSLFEMRQEINAIPLTPSLTRSIGLIAKPCHPMTPITESAWKIAESIQLQTRIDALIDVVNHVITTDN